MRYLRQVRNDEPKDGPSRRSAKAVSDLAVGNDPSRSHRAHTHLSELERDRKGVVVAPTVSYAYTFARGEYLCCHRTDRSSAAAKCRRPFLSCLRCTFACVPRHHHGCHLRLPVFGTPCYENPRKGQ